MGKKNKFPRTQHCQPARYTYSDLRNAAADAAAAATKYNVNVTYSAFLIALHRKFGFSKVRCQRVLDEVDTLTFEAFDTQSLKELALKETGIDLEKIHEEVNSFESYISSTH